MYLFYLDDLLLPVAPQKTEIKINGKNETVTLINEGEVNLLKSPGLTDISFTALLPGIEYPFAQYDDGFLHPVQILDRLETFKTSLQPFDFVVARIWNNGQENVDFRTNMKVSLENYTIKESVKNAQDVEVEIKLKQYKAYGTKTITIKEETAVTTTTREDPKKEEKKEETYTLVAGDTLWGIAKRKLGSGEKWPSIYDLNKDTVEAAAKKYGRSSSSSGHWIYPGTVIKIPG